MAVNVTDANAIPSLAELCIFRDQQPGDRPPSAAGAAMLALIGRHLFPSWALAFYEPLCAAAKGHSPPPRLALIANDAILLAPEPAPGGWRGFIIAEGQAQGQVRAFQWPGEPDLQWLAVPRASAGGGAVWAEEAAFLATRPSPHTPDSLESQLP